MRRLLTLALPLALLMPLAGVAHAESHNPADYPLRVHVYGRNQTTFYHNHQTDEAKGEGRANLFEGGEPKGIDFQFECDQKLQVSSGFETYPAKWNKPGAELVILQPQFGKPGHYDTCHLKIMMKDFVYVMRNGGMATEPSAAFKQWMTVHQYDPEHGKDLPIQTGPPAAGGAGAPPAGAAPPAAPPQ